MPIKTISGQRMYEDDAYALLLTKGPFGLRYPILTRFYVYNKVREVAIKANHEEKMFLLECISEWHSLGRESKTLGETDLLSQYCRAVASRGGAHWTVFFKYESPQEKVRELVECI